MVAKITYTESKKADSLLIARKICFCFFFENLSFLKVYFSIYVCLGRNYRLFLLNAHWSYFKDRGLLQTWDLYKVSAKQHQIVDS